MNRIEASNGAFLVWREGSGGTVEIFDIHVPSESRRKGLGRRLLETLVDPLPEGTTVWAFTRAENRIAHLFYQELRFKLMAYCYDMYGLGQHALQFGWRKGDRS